MGNWRSALLYGEHKLQQKVELLVGVQRDESFSLHVNYQGLQLECTAGERDGKEAKSLFRALLIKEL